MYHDGLIVNAHPDSPEGFIEVFQPSVVNLYDTIIVGLISRTDDSAEADTVTAR